MHLDPTLILKRIFKKCTRRQHGEWTSYGASVPASILLVPNKFINQWLCQYLRIAAIIVLDGQIESRKRMIRSIETRSLEIISPKCSSKNSFLQKRACCFVFDCLNGTACFPFKNYFHRLHYNALNTRNNGKTTEVPKVKLDFARRSFYFLGASIFNSLPLSLRNINCRVLFRKTLDDHYL